MKLKITILVLAIVAALTTAALGAGIVLAKSSPIWDRIIPGRIMAQAMKFSEKMDVYKYSGMMNGNSHTHMMADSETGGTHDSQMEQMHEGTTDHGDMHELVWQGLAEALGITPEELNAELEAGKTITQVAESKGIGVEQLAQTFETLMKTELDQSVADQEITQEQANQMLEHMEGNYLSMLEHMGSEGHADSESCH